MRRTSSLAKAGMEKNRLNMVSWWVLERGVCVWRSGFVFCFGSIVICSSLVVLGESLGCLYLFVNPEEQKEELTLDSGKKKGLCPTIFEDPL